MASRSGNLLRRTLRYLSDTMALGGIANAGTGGADRRGHVLQTRFVADEAIKMVRDEDDQSERVRAAWSLGGALLLAILGLATLVFAWPIGSIGSLALGVAELVAALAVAAVAWRRATRGSMVHLIGIGLVVVSVYAGIVAPPALFTEWELPVLLLSIAAAVSLAIGRR